MKRKSPEESGGKKTASDELSGMFDFVAPTEMVDLPSKGKFYPEDHPLYSQDVIEIKYMTARHEDILTNRSLLKKGVALNRLIDELIVNKDIKGMDLLVGDRNAIMICARASAYGGKYDTSVSCPNCNHKSKHSFDLYEPKVTHGSLSDKAVKTERGTFIITTPHSKIDVEVKLLTGREEAELLKVFSDKKKKDAGMVSEQLKMIIVAVKERKEPNIINYFIENCPAAETRYIRRVFEELSPDLKIIGDFECPSCGHEQELEVAFGADFFWPER